MIKKDKKPELGKDDTIFIISGLKVYPMQYVGKILGTEISVGWIVGKLELIQFGLRDMGKTIFCYEEDAKKVLKNNLNQALKEL